MIKNILFDMGGVVFRQDTAEAFRRFAAAGIDPNEYMGAYGQKDFFLDLETGTITAQEFCQRMAEAAGRAEVTMGEALECWMGFVVDVPVERLRHLEALRPHYRLCLLSNTNPFVMSYMHSTAFSALGRPIDAYFDALYCSYEMGVCKPSPDIFAQAMALGGMEPGESLFVDDSLKNVQAAQAAGLHALHVETNAEWMPLLSEALR